MADIVRKENRTLGPSPRGEREAVRENDATLPGGVVSMRAERLRFSYGVVVECSRTGACHDTSILSPT